MNIISGIARNIQLDVPKGMEVRPTGARARKSIFDGIINYEGLTVVDLFAGSGALGLEAASRGASNIYFSEVAPLHCKCIKANISKLEYAGIDSNVHVVQSDSVTFYKSFPNLEGKVDIIFADPPYKMTAEIMDELFNDPDFAQWAKGALFILETSSSVSKRPTVKFMEYWRIKSIKSQGQSMFYYFESIIS
jgi:16S rRNA (guanine966-N2)-methyltransferase